jgi:hypothetical protein
VRHKLDLELTGQVLLLEDLVLADVGRDHLAQLAVGQQDPQPEVVDATVVRNHRQIAHAGLAQSGDRDLGDPT